MRIKVKVIACSKQNKVEESQEGLKIHLSEQPIKGKANKALIELLAKHFNLKKSQIRITKGLKSNKKEVEIEK